MLVAVHLFIGRLRFLDVQPRSAWLSFAGGSAVAYIFLHVLPEIAAHQKDFSEAVDLSGLAVERWIYALSMLGLATFYGLERAMVSAKGKQPRGRSYEEGVLWIHTASFAFYNLLIGYLLNHREDEAGAGLMLYAVAMILHFVTTDFGMRRDHEAAYDKISRWVLTAALVAGWIAGLAIQLPPLAIGCLFAFLAGGVILNVMKEELPSERESRFGPFAAGAALYGALLLLVEI